MMTDAHKRNIRVQRLVVLVSVSLFVLKLVAYQLTQSVAILTDALESTVNVVAGFIGLYSITLSGKPRDADHPYGHGKVEFISAAIEGTLISIAGLFIINEAISNLLHPHTLRQLDLGILLVSGTALVNFLVGRICIRTGKRNHSLALQASGKHLLSDTWSTVGIVAGLLLIHFTGTPWLDSAVAIAFALLIIFSGYRIIRSSVSGIMDEADRELLQELVLHLDQNRRPQWIDLHNLRVIKYGSVLHLDCHLTVPWYYNVHQAHDEIDLLDRNIKDKYGESVELFVHADGCLEFSCALCTLSECPQRQQPFQQRIPWTVENISRNSKHRI